MRRTDRFRITAGVAAVLVAAMAIWLVLRIVGGGSDAAAASAQEHQHQAAAESLSQLSTLVADTSSVTIEDVSAIEDRSRSGQQLLTQASDGSQARQLQDATTTLVTALRSETLAAAAAAREQARTEDEAAKVPVQGAAPSAAENFAATVGQLRSGQQRDTAAARQAADDASSQRSSAMRYLILLLLLAAAVAVAWFAGLLPATTRPEPALAERPGRLEPARQERDAEPVLAHAGGPRAGTREPAGQAAGQPVARLSSSQPAAGSWHLGSSARAPSGHRARLAATTSAHPGTALDAAVHSGLVVYAGSMIGPEHRGGKNFVPREDAYSWSPGHDSSVIVLAVADGVGSARNSHAASLIATEVAVAHLRGVSSGDVATWYDRPGLWRDQALTLMSSVASCLSPDQVDSRAVTIELSTGSSTSGRRSVAPATTLVVALGVTGPDGVRVLWAGVGDSQVSVLAPGATQLSWSQPEGDAPSGTRALPRDAAHVISSQYFLPNGHAFLLTTDGCEKVLSLDPSTVPLLHQMIRTPGDTRSLLELLHRTPPGAGDDRTLVLFGPALQDGGS